MSVSRFAARRGALLLLLAPLLLATAAPPPAAKYLFGPDRRRPLSDPEQQAFRPIGWVSGGEEGGTAALVGRGDVLLTAAHTFFRDGMPLAERFWFYPDGLDGPRVEILEIQAGTNNPSHDRVENDWAVARLAANLGSRNGALSYARLSNSLAVTNRGRFLLVGFNTDTDVGHTKFATPCSLRPRRDDDLLRGETNIWLHDCDTRAGASGAPIVLLAEDGQFYVVGLHVEHVFRNGTKEGDPFDPQTNAGVAVRVDGGMRAALQKALGDEQTR